MQQFPHVLKIEHPWNHYVDELDKPRPAFEWLFFGGILLNTRGAKAVEFYDAYLPVTFKLDPLRFDSTITLLSDPNVLFFFENLTTDSRISFLTRWIDVKTADLTRDSFKNIFRDRRFGILYKAICYLSHPAEKWASLYEIFSFHEQEWLWDSDGDWGYSTISLARGLYIAHFL